MSDTKRQGLTVVVPTLNAEAALRPLLSGLTSERLDLDVVVSDGGSTDATMDRAARHQARITAAEGGRGPQVRAGVEAALSEWLLILHADSRLPADWEEAVTDFVNDPCNMRRAGYFAFALDDTGPAARRLERLVNWRSRTLGLPYGDQGLLIAHTFLDELGGYPDLPLMEDVAIVRRIGKARLHCLETPLATSAEKFRRDGYLRRSARNLFCLTLYFLGVPPRAIRWVYG